MLTIWKIQQTPVREKYGIILEPYRLRRKKMAQVFGN